ncbi:MAG: DUF1854 domain-containing protein [Planctomycetota bacterium]|jgi:hypothetical protein|nr:DUF1854 domain-containing protein [Planctomycetota bacterium]MDA1200727.1 DUF1854 domain-containing protein [Planctomycetota bacterium]
MSAAWSLEPRRTGGVDFVAADGTRHPDVDLRRGFPLSAPREGVAVVGPDGSELAWIASLDALVPGVQALVEEVLAAREFVPVIERIEGIIEGRPAEWSVVTDRGACRFELAHPDDIARQPDGGLSITDTSGIRYRVPEPAALDVRSRRLLDRLL